MAFTSLCSRSQFGAASDLAGLFRKIITDGSSWSGLHGGRWRANVCSMLNRLRSAFLYFVSVFAAGPVGAAEMAFSLVEYGERCGTTCPQVIAAEGEITAKTPQAFVDFAAKHIGSGRLHSIVLIHSQGGRVVAAMEWGKALRKLGAAAVVAKVPPGGSRKDLWILPGRCYSACVYALMGAKKRVSLPESRVGIHRMFMYEANMRPDAGSMRDRIYAGEPLVSRLSEYAQMMGVSTDLVRKAESINPDQIHILSAAELRRWKLAGPKL